MSKSVCFDEVNALTFGEPSTRGESSNSDPHIWQNTFNYWHRTLRKQLEEGNVGYVCTCIRVGFTRVNKFSCRLTKV